MVGRGYLVGVCWVLDWTLECNKAVCLFVCRYLALEGAKAVVAGVEAGGVCGVCLCVFCDGGGVREREG